MDKYARWGPADVVAQMLDRHPSSLLVCERYLLSITLLPVLLSSFTDNRVQILYFQCGLKPNEFQDLSELPASVYTVEKSSPIVLFKVTIDMEDTIATATFMMEKWNCPRGVVHYYHG